MMKNNLLTCGILLTLLLAGCTPEKTAAGGLIDRISNHTATNLLTEIGPTPTGTDFFEIDSRNGNVLVRGNNTSSITTGINWYLKYVAGIHISWNNLTQDFPAKLPLPAGRIRHETRQPLRYYLNYCTFSYSTAFWDWPRWEKELDWMALHGINLSLSITGNEVVWRNVLTRLGYSRREAGEFIAGPAYMAWWQMNNLEGWGGPNPDEWYKGQEALQRKIIDRMHQLGIEPILPGFAGMVPHDIADKLGYRITDPGTWCSFPRPAFLRPDDPDFNTLADLYYEETEKLYGKARYYAMDPFHEGGNATGIDLDAAGRTLMAAMKRANPEAVWVAQAWQANPRPAMIANLDAHDLLVLDLYSEKRPQWGDPDSRGHRPEGYGKHDWIYCMLLNFGGRVGLHGRMDNLIDGFHKAVRHPAGRTLSGVGATPEGIENNPVMFELLYELPWRAEPFTKEDWIKSYITARYGRFDPTIHEAWLLLARHPYNCPNDYSGEGAVESLFCARPGIHLRRASTWGSAIPYYDSDYTRQAAEKLLSVADTFKDNANFRYDLVDVLRQSIADNANDRYARLSKAHTGKDIHTFKALADSFMVALQCQDKLLATQKEFTVGHWLEQAKSLSHCKTNRQLYEWNARTLITVWGNRPASEEGGLHDYSNREWSGLLADLYAYRWKLFFDHTIKEMQGETPPPIDFFAIEEAWTRERRTYPVTSGGDGIQTAKEIYGQLFGPIR